MDNDYVIRDAFSHVKGSIYTNNVQLIVYLCKRAAANRRTGTLALLALVKRVCAF
jgi:hypothetical protein